MKKLKSSIYIFISVLLISILMTINAYAENNIEKKLEVLFISSYNSNFISFDDHVRGIKDGFNNNVNLRIEYMDNKALDGEENELNFYNLLKYSIDNYDRFDAIIAGDDQATEFCIKYRDDLFKDIPISFLGVQNFNRLDRAINTDNMSGVAEIESIEGTINLIKRFHKNVNNIIFINDNGKNFYNKITSKYKEFNFDSIITEELSIDEFKKIISSLDNSNAIIVLYPENFEGGEWASLSDINNMIALSNCKIPTYNVLSYGVGTGSIGGRVINHYNQGKNAARIALGLIRGEDPKKLYIDDDRANSYIFDYNVLKNFNIDKNNLPLGSIVLNDPINVFIQYKNMFLGMLMIFMGLISIVLALLGYIYSRAKYKKEMLKAMHKAEETNKFKTHFISNISDELKTPINVIISAMQLAKFNRNKCNISCRSCFKDFDVVSDNCYRLLRLLNNIIDVQKFEVNDLKLELQCVNIVRLIEDLVLSVVPYTEHKNLNIVFDTNEEEVITEVDCNKIERVFLNLLSNAIKFSKENGNIKVNLEFYENSMVAIIEDDRIGIEDTSIDKIFEKFTQLDDSLTRNNEGTGIGLSISQAFIKLHKGNIFVDSIIGKGTKFIVEIPIKYINPTDDIIIVNEKNNIKRGTKIELSDIYI